jgi:hypothetical protein
MASIPFASSHKINIEQNIIKIKKKQTPLSNFHLLNLIASIMLSLHQILLTILIKIVVSQEPDGSCSCTPLVYKWKLDFTQSCPPADITVGNGAGVKDAFCTVKNGSNLTDLKPVSVTRYQIIELGQDLTPIKVKEESMITLKDGDEISFSSITGAQPSVVSGGLQVHMDGLNSADEKIVLEWIVRYSNLCEVYPYSDGNSLGWMEFVIRVSYLAHLF